MSLFKGGEDPECHFYLISITDMSLEHYLTALTPSLRLAMFHFRTGNHTFPVEIGRWHHSYAPYESRRCNLCSLNELGNEFHYLLVCPKFDDLRVKYVQRYFLHRHVHKTRTSNVRLQKLDIFIKHVVNYFVKYTALDQ